MIRFFLLKFFRSGFLKGDREEVNNLTIYVNHKRLKRKKNNKHLFCFGSSSSFFRLPNESWPFDAAGVGGRVTLALVRLKAAHRWLVCILVGCVGQLDDRPFHLEKRIKNEEIPSDWMDGILFNRVDVVLDLEGIFRLVIKRYFRERHG